ncbi:hypothetical protein FG379_001027 [Cryptosporidium bovis]|uniref:uncharacterized protein n=1 Tax=Cryptosporidium bovis TaxID=310047 RepID=UPI003519F2F7|nr:hypothetical protein FG379_001027 [Cryptosporidium bovis]
MNFALAKDLLLMEFETSSLSVKFSRNLQSQSLWRHITQSLREYDIIHKDDSIPRKNDFSSIQSNTIHLKNNISEAVIPFCIISPKFDYRPHINIIRTIKKTQQESEREYDTTNFVVVLFVTFESYDTITNNVEVDKIFGHKVVDLLFHEVQKYYLVDDTRCIVIWIGTRDLLSQESLFCIENIQLPNIVDNKKGIGISYKHPTDQSSLDKCIISLLINNSIDSIETKNELEASQYLSNIISAICEIQKRSLSSKYKPRISSFPSDDLWVSQLFQIPGLSEDSARAIERIFRTPGELITYIDKNIERHKLNSNGEFNLNKFDLKPKVPDLNWFNKLLNISFLCSKGLNNRKLGKARAKKLVLLYNGISSPTDILSDPILCKD